VTDESGAAPTAKVFKHVSHEISRRKEFDLLCQTELMVAGIQTVGEGGETNLHSHTHLDGFWFVLKGRARFYTYDDEVVADLGPLEGILVPRDYAYWFERVGDENLEILQVEASDTKMGGAFTMASDRIDYTPSHNDMDANRAEIAKLLTNPAKS
jgi:mannose-6-phosphate isomerase-like protein (cupin superfamily)